MKFSRLTAILLLLSVLSVAPAGCERIDVDEHEYDTVRPYLPSIPPDPDVVTVTEQSAADGDADAAEAEAVEQPVIPPDLKEAVLKSTGQLNLHIQQNPPQPSPAAPQK